MSEPTASTMAPATNPPWLGAHLDRVFDAQIAYGRWILNSLLLVSGGAVLAITQSGDKAYEILGAAAYPLVTAVISSLFAGMSAWVNFTVSSLLYVRIISSPGFSPSGRWRLAIRASIAGAFVFTFFAVGMLIWAAVCVVQSLHGFH